MLARIGTPRRPAESVSVRHEDGKETIEQLDDIVTIGNDKPMAMLTPHDEARIVPRAWSDLVLFSLQRPPNDGENFLGISLMAIDWPVTTEAVVQAVEHE